jgi:predicted RNase H-like HicB family nuclease
VKTYRYTVVIHPEEDGQGYWAEVPALPGCNTLGDTIEEVLTNARDAIRLCIEDREAHGEPIPEEAEPHQAIVIDVEAAA